MSDLILGKHYMYTGYNMPPLRRGTVVKVLESNAFRIDYPTRVWVAFNDGVTQVWHKDLALIIPDTGPEDAPQNK